MCLLNETLILPDCSSMNQLCNLQLPSIGLIQCWHYKSSLNLQKYFQV